MEYSFAADGDMVRAAYEMHAEDDDCGQAGTLVRGVWIDEQRARLVDTLAGQMAQVKGDVRKRSLWYIGQIDAETRRKVEAKLAGKPAEPPVPKGCKEPSRGSIDPDAQG